MEEVLVFAATAFTYHHSLRRSPVNRISLFNLRPPTNQLNRILFFEQCRTAARRRGQRYATWGRLGDAKLLLSLQGSRWPPMEMQEMHAAEHYPAAVTDHLDSNPTPLQMLKHVLSMSKRFGSDGKEEGLFSCTRAWPLHAASKNFLSSFIPLGKTAERSSFVYAATRVPYRGRKQESASTSTCFRIIMISLTLTAIRSISLLFLATGRIQEAYWDSGYTG
ncbi:hypothetical protein CPC08DRAFT_509817 [Agrocybe pediades]|nr:hypothetical protein CPC08DRAFT_509817 [Agrocybe pediades]